MHVFVCEGPSGPAANLRLEEKGRRRSFLLFPRGPEHQVQSFLDVSWGHSAGQGHQCQWRGRQTGGCHRPGLPTRLLPGTRLWRETMSPGTRGRLALLSFTSLKCPSPLGRWHEPGTPGGNGARRRGLSLLPPALSHTCVHAHMRTHTRTCTHSIRNWFTRVCGLGGSRSTWQPGHPVGADDVSSGLRMSLTAGGGQRASLTMSGRETSLLLNLLFYSGRQ